MSEKILIVDNTPIHISLLGEVLSPQYEVLVATSGERALAQVAQSKPDLILLDIVMAPMDGYEVCQRLKDAPASRDIPVIFLTSKDGVEDETRGFALGAVDYIHKPFSPAIVRARVRTQLDLKRQRDELQELTEMKNRFLAICAHDLRSPLASIATLTQMFLEDKHDPVPKNVHFIERTMAAAHGMLNLVNGLLDVSVIEKGRFSMSLQPASLPELVTKRIELLRPLTDRKALTVNSYLDPVPEFGLDAQRVGQLFDNVFTNAIKYSPKGKTIFVRLTAEDGIARVEVEDQGPGLTNEEQERMFNEYQTGSARPTGSEASTGLGLYIVKKIVEAHGGRVSMKSRPGQGCTVSFSLPIKR